jgi:hypothetical protein
MKALITSKMAHQYEISTSNSWKLGNFLLLDPKGFPQEMIPSEYFNITVDLRGHVGSIVNRIKQCKDLIPTNDHVKLKITNLPAGCQYPSEVTNNDPFLIERNIEDPQIMKQFEENLQKFDLLNKFRYLVLNLLFCHLIFKKFVIQDMEIEKFKVSEDKLIDWITVEMFKPINGSLPIFGNNISINDDQVHVGKTGFGEIQSFLINFMRSSGSHRILAQVSIALIGYWFKNYYPNQWVKSIPNDHTFWEMMIDLFRINNHLVKDFHLKYVVDQSSPNSNINHSYSTKKGKRQKIK